MSQIRREVLRAFKKLHRTRQAVFLDDHRTLSEARKQINETFRKNSKETNEDKIKEMVRLAKDVEVELRTNVIQAREKEQGVYALRITKETTRLDNAVCSPNIVLKPSRDWAARIRSVKNNCYDDANSKKGRGT